jgi:hypothetical protein
MLHRDLSTDRNADGLAAPHLPNGEVATHADESRRPALPPGAADAEAGGIGGAGPWSPRAITARVRQLIARSDGGDVCAAARRLGVPVSHLVQLERVLAEGMQGDAEELLAAAVLRYHADATWLLTGAERTQASVLPPSVRVWLAKFLLAISTRMIEEYRTRLGQLGGPGARRLAADAPPLEGGRA